jgi:DMSO/TMAO reductase YedYZ molybdopterin-dependent catalytic subunit
MDFHDRRFVEKAVRWNWEEFLAQPQVTMTSDIHCVTGWSRYDNAGTGVHAAHLLDLCKPEKKGNALSFLFFGWVHDEHPTRSLCG